MIYLFIYLLLVCGNIHPCLSVLRYNGSGVQITYSLRYQFTFSCEYDFRSFPFDTQGCGISIKLQQSLGCDPHWDTKAGGVQVYGEISRLSMYSLSPTRYRLGTDGQDLVLCFLFEHKFASYVFTTFIPCIILCGLAHVTLTHFQLTDFNDRIMVTLSLLIVLASLFSQMSSTFPSSPDSKLVDHFFLYCITRVSLIFLLHSFIEVSICLARKNKEKEEGEGAAIHGDNTVLGIKMKLAWVSEPAGDNEPPKKGLNKPAIINRVGCVMLLVLDVVVTAVSAILITIYYYEKYNSYQACNATVS